MYENYDPNNPNLPGSRTLNSGEKPDSIVANWGVEDPLPPTGYVVVSKGTSLEDGVNEKNHNQKQSEKFIGRDVTYVDPNYKFRDLNDIDKQAQYLLDNPLLRGIPKEQYITIPPLKAKLGID